MTQYRGLLSELNKFGPDILLRASSLQTAALELLSPGARRKLRLNRQPLKRLIVVALPRYLLDI